ncbi:hypothetical protein [Loigolactobacillus jiayinensis]|uniref:Uncharacterized protein n=1 Tax=Loigolactobacillus jiayinensis TaxID=2486016 RepID=A0ABW1REW4_9LACO|nr:hypothetical protein [Loigolactobacillus jiayinensis]
MKISLLKLPGFYDTLFMLFLLLSCAVLGIGHVLPVLHVTNFFSARTALFDHLTIFTWIGLGLHLISYFRAFHIPAMLLANIAGIGAFLIFWLLPSVALLPLILLAIAILLTQKTAKRKAALHHKHTHVQEQNPASQE